MEKDLEHLSDALLEETSRRFSEQGKELVRSKWEQIRNIAAQNAGYKSWGKHLLKLKRETLTTVFHETIHCVEEEMLELDHLIDLKQIDLAMAKALFIEYNPTFVAEYREQFQQIFPTLFALEGWHTRAPLAGEMLIGHLISFLPLFDFAENSPVTLLKYLDGKWELVTYKVVYIPLVAEKIYAYGLEPTRKDVLPMLIFRSTPYPAASGFLEAVLSDLHPTRSIGEDIFACGKPALDVWLAGRPKVECYGMSLGGALAYHAGEAYGDRLLVHAYMAPGLSRRMSQICGRGFFHCNDLIQLVGIHPESKHFELFSAITATDVNFLQAHAIPSGIEPMVVLKLNPRYENKTFARSLVAIFKMVIVTPIWLPLVCLHWATKAWKRVKKRG